MSQVVFILSFLVRYLSFPRFSSIFRLGPPKYKRGMKHFASNSDSANSMLLCQLIAFLGVQRFLISRVSLWNLFSMQLIVRLTGEIGYWNVYIWLTTSLYWPTLLTTSTRVRDPGMLRNRSNFDLSSYTSRLPTQKSDQKPLFQR